MKAKKKKKKKGVFHFFSFTDKQEMLLSGQKNLLDLNKMSGHLLNIDVRHNIIG